MMTDETKKRYENIIKGITDITLNCRDDMHEPDEQGIYAVAFGCNLDNACIATEEDYKNHVDGVKPNNADLTIAIEHYDDDGDENAENVVVVNVADLIAIVRMLDAERKFNSDMQSATF